MSGGKDKTIRRWDLEKHRLVGSPLHGHSGEILALQYDMEEDLIISGCAEATLILWRLYSGKLLHMIENAHNRGISNLYFNGQFILTGLKDGSIKVWLRARTVPKIRSSDHEVAYGLIRSNSNLKNVRGIVLNIILYRIWLRRPHY